MLATQSSQLKDPTSKEVDAVPEKDTQGCPPAYTHVQVCTLAHLQTLNTYKHKIKNYIIEMAQWLRVLPALAEDPGSIPGNHMTAHTYL